jgi:hypothetical protein
MKEIRVLGVYIENRVAEVKQVQEILSKYGCNIKTRLGLHNVDENQCSVSGLVILELFGDVKDWDALEAALKACAGVKVQKMSF